ncbi:DMT family transporter [Streptomyces sp. NBC_00015]|uniref:DMT family transporter n=1 Tax=unclassified Streptomyces TaxID=2593676 RepID=UPI0022561669|nr:DMT family transporter [Streptomyces sp. NBC_00103]MCX5368453.1 DMT family transporter [Streptomyces sp. NBC_00103]
MVCALGAAVCFGTATVLQAMAARAAVGGSGGDAALLLRAVREWRYLAGLALDGLGFLFQIAALRSVPIYAVGAALASSLAVTAVVAARLLRVRLSRTEWAAVGVVCAGLAMLGLAAGTEGEESGPRALPWVMLGAAGGVLLLGLAGRRLTGRARALVLGLGAGFGFGVVEVAVRLIDSLDPSELLTDPALYALLLGGCAAFLLLTTALQRGSVTTATAGMVIGETIGPALVGVVWLGDRTREGLGWLAVLGFAVAVAGALALARFGEAPEAAPVAEAAPEPPVRPSPP